MLWFKWFSDLHFTSQNGGCHFKNLKISRNKLKQTKKKKKKKKDWLGIFTQVVKEKHWHSGFRHQ